MTAAPNGLGVSSIPSIFSIPRIAQALDPDGGPTGDRVERRLDRFVADFLWDARPMRSERTDETLY